MAYIPIRATSASDMTPRRIALFFNRLSDDFPMNFASEALASASASARVCW